MSENLDIHLLPKLQWGRLRKIYKENNARISPCSPNIVTHVVAQLPDETIVGSLSLELIPHAGGLWIAEPFRGQGVAVKLYKEIENKVLTQVSNSGYYTFPSNPTAVRVMEKLGLEKMPWEVWRRSY